jgi:hypothetical protein
MSDAENLAVVVANDPMLKKHYFSKLDDPAWRVPLEYETEVKQLLLTPVALIPSITSPEDYKTLVAALQAVTGCKSRIAVITHQAPQAGIQVHRKDLLRTDQQR